MTHVFLLLSESIKQAECPTADYAHVPPERAERLIARGRGYSAEYYRLILTSRIRKVSAERIAVLIIVKTAKRRIQILIITCD
jgi:hypothetical protein